MWNVEYYYLGFAPRSLNLLVDPVKIWKRKKIIEIKIVIFI